MPFAPIPTNFLKYLDNLTDSGAVVLELGSGNGGFSQVLNKPGINFYSLDNSCLVDKNEVQVIGDALMPPVLSGSVDLLVAANLFRHLLTSDPQGLFLNVWQDLVKPGGSLVIFEDEPSSHPVAVRNYRDVQMFLAKLVGTSRGPLLSRSQFQLLKSVAVNADQWEVELEANHFPADEEVVLGFLAGSEGQVASEVYDLMERIKVNGLAYGDFWWAQWRGANNG